MPDKPLRRAQLIAPFGVGALSVAPGGMSLVTAGLDHWFTTNSAFSNSQTNFEEFKVNEWRLEKILGINHLRIPPDYRVNRGYTPATAKINQQLKIPALRFPQWHSCVRCGSLEKFYLTTQQEKLQCSACDLENRRAPTNQVQFVSICEAGHMDEFPWREWVHQGKANCNGDLKLLSGGSGALIESRIVCACNKKRSIRGTNFGTFLSDNMFEAEEKWTCTGGMPWHGSSDDHEECILPPRASFRSASNLYFANIKSSIWIPTKPNDVSAQILPLLKQPPLSDQLSALADLGLSQTAENILPLDSGNLLGEFKSEDIQRAINEALGITSVDSSTQNEPGSSEANFRYQEYEILCNEISEDDIKISKRDIDAYDPIISTHFSQVMMVDKLMETRVLTGFGRILPSDSEYGAENRKKLWKNPPIPYSVNDWLPAYQVVGEGIFLQFNQHLLAKWSANQNLLSRVDDLATRINQILVAKNMPARSVNPKFLLIHTFAHVLINRLAFECGYGAASIRERLYVDDNSETSMQGLLLYTAAGDSEGSLGGLVRMGLPGRLEPVIEAILHESRWCANDPVCMEQGEPSSGGQGPDNANLAACYACSLVPETSCEEFNRLLDRAPIVGHHADEFPGYFSMIS